jgi:CRP-like cAMP-binding protein
MDVRDDTNRAPAAPPPRASGSILAIFARHPLLCRLGEGEADRIAQRAHRRNASTGEVIFQKGDPADSFFAVTSGCVRIRARSRSGGEIVYSVIQPGETFGEVSLVDGRGRSADAVTGGPCELWEIDKGALSPILTAQSPFAAQLSLLLCERLRRCSPQVEDAMFLHTASRLAKAVLRSAEPDGESGLRVRATQKQLGDMIGLSRESTNKQIQVWVRQSWIKTAKGALVVLDPAALAACAEPVAPAP